MFEVVQQLKDNSYLVVDTEDGKIDKVTEDELARAKSLGYRIRFNDNLKDYTMCYTDLVKANIFGRLDYDITARNLCQSLKTWGSRIKALPILPVTNHCTSKLIQHGDSFILVVNESNDIFFSDGDAFLYMIREDGIFGKEWHNSYLNEYKGVVGLLSTKEFGIITLDLLAEGYETFSEKTKKRKRGKVSDIFTSLFK
jgi:hypothetical protein